MSQYLVFLPRNRVAGDPLEFCLAASADSRRIGQHEVALGRGTIEVWNEPEDDVGDLHVATHETTKRSLGDLGQILLRLTEHYGTVTWTLED